MYPKKIGGGGELEFYDPDDGRYASITQERKNQLLEQEMSNIVMRYVFGIEDTYMPRFPIAGFHDDSYCELYVRHCIYTIYRCMPWEKITNYLLVKKQSGDKSNFFKLLGYGQLNAKDLYDQIMENSDFSKMKYQKLKIYGIYVVVPTKIFSKKDSKYVSIKTIWLYKKEDKKMHFITVDISGGK